MKSATAPIDRIARMEDSAPDLHADRGRKPAFAALALLALIWGYNWVAMKVALSYAPPATFGALRAGSAAAFLFAFLAACGKSLRMPVSPRRLVALALFQTTGFVGLMSCALATGDAGRTAILVYTMPFWVLLLAAPVLGERLTRAKVLAGGCGFAGIVMIFSPWAMHGDLSGMALAAGAGLDWAVAVMIAKSMRVHGIWALLRLNAWQALIGCIPLGVLALLVRAQPIHWTPAFILALLYSVLFGTGIAWFLWLFVLSRLSASISGLAALMIPVVGILADWAQLGVRPGLWETLGGGMLIFGLSLIAWAQSRGIA